MEYKDLFVSIGVALVIVVAFLAWGANINNNYGTNIGGNLSETMKTVQYIENVTDMGEDVANNTQSSDSSGGVLDAVNNLVKRGTSTITIMGKMLGIIPSMMNDGARIIGLDENNAYIAIARALFWFVFGLTLAYLFIIGAKKL